MINNHYHHLAFGPDAIERQRVNGSYVAYGAHLERPDDGPDELSARELRMIADATQFCLGTVTPTGWPYLQYRSGPAGFVRHLGGNALRFVDLPGNNQFVTLGNLSTDDRLAMFFVDYPRKQRLKVLGRGLVHEVSAARSKWRWRRLTGTAPAASLPGTTSSTSANSARPIRKRPPPANRAHHRNRAATSTSGRARTTREPVTALAPGRTRT